MKKIFSILLCSISFIVSAQNIMDCNDAVIPIETETTFNHTAPTTAIKYFAPAGITASNYTQNTTTNYFSSTKISLNNGFKAKTSGSIKFSATIGSCSNITSKQSISEDTFSSSTIYPNPSKDFITLAWNGIIVSKITITSIEGKIIYASRTLESQKEISINVEQYPSGIYNVIIENKDQKSISKKFIKL